MNPRKRKGDAETWDQFVPKNALESHIHNKAKRFWEAEKKYWKYREALRDAMYEPAEKLSSSTGAGVALRGHSCCG